MKLSSSKSSKSSFYLRVLGSNILQKGGKKAIAILHIYVILVVVLINALLYVTTNIPGSSKYYTGSVLNVPDLNEAIHEDIDHVLSRHNPEITNRISDLEHEIETLRLSKQEIVNLEPQIIEREITKVVYVNQNSSTSQSSGIAHKSNSPSQVNNTGSMIVKDSSCASGFASVTPRLERECTK